MMSDPLVNGSSQIAVPFQFPFIVLLRHGRGAIYLECKLLDITKCGFDFIGVSGCRRRPLLPPLFYSNDCGGQFYSNEE
jgi:hypothetical protein